MTQAATKTPAERETWNAQQSAWRAQQDAWDIPTIEQTVRALTPSGRRVEVNRFDYNLGYINDSYVQCTDGGWIKARNLKARTERRAAAAIASTPQPVQAGG